MPLIRAIIPSAILVAPTATTGFGKDSPIPKIGDSFSEYGMVEGWAIYSDATTMTCLAERTNEAENVMQVGVTKDHDGIVRLLTRKRQGSSL